MKKMISLAVILSTVLSVQAFADGPNDGHRPGQPTVWQNGSDHHGHAPQGGPDAHRQGDHDQRGPDRDGHDKRDQARHEQDHFAWRGNDFRKGHPAPAPFRGDEYRVRDWSDRDRDHHLDSGERRPRPLNARLPTPGREHLTRRWITAGATGSVRHPASIYSH